MICPQCGAEFVDDVEVCADCEVPLVAAPPEPDPRFRSPLEADEPWAVLLETRDLSEAEQAAAALEREGIPRHVAESEPTELTVEPPLPDEHGPGTQWAIHVPEARLDEARSVLERQPAAIEEPEESTAPEVKGLVLAYLVLLGLLFVWGLISLYQLLFP